MTPAENKIFYSRMFNLALPIALQHLMLASVAAADAMMLGRVAKAEMTAGIMVGNELGAGKLEQGKRYGIKLRNVPWVIIHFNKYKWVQDLTREREQA
jgi:Na+-driven multidrug efflux pump